eukprot:COSAG02_NODE_48678_length_332_cov_0.660944_1_plen_76_part_10
MVEIRELRELLIYSELLRRRLRLLVDGPCGSCCSMILCIGDAVFVASSSTILNRACRFNFLVTGSGSHVRSGLLRL